MPATQITAWAAFKNRVDLALRDVEIGYTKGAGSAARAAMTQEEWMSAAEALAFVESRRAICKRAHAGLVKARAARFICQGNSSDNVDVPCNMWWAQGEAALTQNWKTGDFETWIDGRIHLQAFGVVFNRLDIHRMLPMQTNKQGNKADMPTKHKIFIGHGRSKEWLVLKDFLQNRLNLPVEEFNSAPIAGIHTADRLKEMLNNAAFAFLVMTGEDEQPGGAINPRLNVVHEAGLFQGRLGFEKAIILLEEGCDEFSNIHGLGQIRFPQGDISPKYEEIRRTLEREGLIS